MDFSRKMIVPPDQKINLAKFDPAGTYGYKHDHKTEAKLEKRSGESTNCSTCFTPKRSAPC